MIILKNVMVHERKPDPLFWKTQLRKTRWGKRPQEAE